MGKRSNSDTVEIADVRQRWIGQGLAVLLLAGCTDPGRPTLVPVTGRVVIDGQPLTAGAIIFHPSEGNPYMKDRPSSLLQLDGSFSMKTFPFGKGVSPGPYQVTLAPELATRIRRSEYARADTTPWSVEVPVTGLSGYQFEIAAGDAATQQ